jgi:hypothetical protein
VDLKEIGCEIVGWIHVAQDIGQCQTFAELVICVPDKVFLVSFGLLMCLYGHFLKLTNIFVFRSMRLNMITKCYIVPCRIWRKEQL